MNVGVTVCAAFGGFLFGYDTAVVNGAVFQMKTHFGFDINSWEAGLIVSIGIVGAFFGSMVAGHFASTRGRWTSILIADILFVLGSLLLAAAGDLPMVYVGRFILGLGIGVASVTIPIYLAEMSPADVRGRVITLNNVFLCGAQFFASLVCAAFAQWTSDNVGWRWMFGLGAVPAVLQLVALLTYLPETPRFLQLKGKREESEKVAAKFGVDITDFAEEGDGFTFSELFRKDMRRRLIVGVGLQACQQLSGINTIMYYSSEILHNAGYEGDKAPVIWSIPLAATNAIFTVAGIPVVDRYGRRRLLLVSLTGCAVAIILMSGVQFGMEASSIPKTSGGVLSLVLLMVYLAFFAPGIGPIPWIMNAEIYPTHLRASAAAVATMMNWGSNAAVSQAFPVLMGSAGSGATFLIVAVFVLGSIWFSWRFVPETRCLSLEQIDHLFADNEEERRLHAVSSIS